MYAFLATWKADLLRKALNRKHANKCFPHTQHEMAFRCYDTLLERLYGPNIILFV